MELHKVHSKNGDDIARLLGAIEKYKAGKVCCQDENKIIPKEAKRPKTPRRKLSLPKINQRPTSAFVTEKNKEIAAYTAMIYCPIEALPSANDSGNRSSSLG
jgi:hypothetical protein